MDHQKDPSMSCKATGVTGTRIDSRSCINPQKDPLRTATERGHDSKTTPKQQTFRFRV